MASQATMGWDELARAIIQNILEEQGGLCAVLPFLSLLIVLFVVGFSWKLLSSKQEELDRMAREKEKLESQLLKRRLSSANKKEKKK